MSDAIRNGSFPSQQLWIRHCVFEHSGPALLQERTAMSASIPLSTVAPRGLNIRQAAAYWGVSPNTFKKLVRLGLAPPAPLKLPGLDRNIYDRQALDKAMSARAQRAVP